LNKNENETSNENRPLLDENPSPISTDENDNFAHL